jgi:hypothetical protein
MPSTEVKSIGGATSWALVEHLSSHIATSDAAGPEIRLEVNVSDQ